MCVCNVGIHKTWSLDTWPGSQLSFGVCYYSFAQTLIGKRTAVPGCQLRPCHVISKAFEAAATLLVRSLKTRHTKQPASKDHTRKQSEP